MSVYTTRQQLHTKAGQGLGVCLPISSVVGGAGTAAAVGSGGMSLSFVVNAIGTTFPGTLVSFPTPPSLSSPTNLINFIVGNISNRGGFLAWMYRIGTFNVNGTGNQFTHDAAVTFPLLRTQFGVASRPISLIPMFHVTTALSTTAAELYLRNATGPAAGYTNQDGTSQTGAEKFTFPSATTAANSCYIPMLNVSTAGLRDSGVRDVSNIDVTVAAGAGVVTLYGLELLLPINSPSGLSGGYIDPVMSGLLERDLKPAVPTSGTLTSLLAFVEIGSATAVAGLCVIEGVLNV